MPALVPIALFGFFPLVLCLFLFLPARKAVLYAILIGWLFLPRTVYSIEGLPNISKDIVIVWATLFGVFLFDFQRLATFRWHLADVPLILWCLCPLVSSLSNHLGLYDGLSAVFYTTTQWGIPYFLGRIYFTDRASIREAILTMITFGLLYIPFCLWEIRMSPQLHYQVYGIVPSSFLQQMRYGGFRPIVFLGHGLLVAIWMASLTVLALWLWRRKALPKMLLLRPVWIVLALAILTLLTKTLTAYVIVAMGCLFLFLLNTLNTKKAPLLFVCLTLIAPIYLTTRIGAGWSGEELVSFVHTYIDDARAESLATRINNEVVLSDKAMQKPYFGWGRWGRSRIRDKYDKDISITDSLWIITLGETGLVGLTLLFAVLLVPLWGVRRYFSCSHFYDSSVVIQAVAVLIALRIVNLLVNADFSAILLLLEGGLVCVGLVAEEKEEDTATTTQLLPVLQPVSRFI